MVLWSPQVLDYSQAHCCWLHNKTEIEEGWDKEGNSTHIIYPLLPSHYLSWILSPCSLWWKLSSIQTLDPFELCMKVAPGCDPHLCHISDLLVFSCPTWTDDLWSKCDSDKKPKSGVKKQHSSEKSWRVGTNPRDLSVLYLWLLWGSCSSYISTILLFS